MTPYQVLQLFEDGYAEGAGRPIDDATAALAQWLAEYKDILSPFDWNLLLSIGMTLFERGVQERIHLAGSVDPAAAAALEALRRRI